jgi:hypothetical protein
MTPSDVKRREILELSWNLFVSRLAIRGAVGSAIAATQSSCGGGASDDSSPGGTAGTTPPPSATPMITSISSTTPQALTAFSLSTSGVDVTQSFTVTLINGNTGGSGSITLTPIRTLSDGTVIVAAPLCIDGSTADSTSFPATITITQNGVASPAVSLTIGALPTLATLGVTLGTVSRAMYNFQQIVLGSSINAQEGLALLAGNAATGAALRSSARARAFNKRLAPKERHALSQPSDTGPGTSSGSSLLDHLQTRLTGTILARNDIDRIVTDNTVSISVGTAPDGTALAFNSTSVDMMDRILAQYLLATYGSTPTSTSGGLAKGQSRKSAPSATPQGSSLSSLTNLTNTLTTVAGAASATSAGQTLWGSSPSTTTDNALAALSLMQTVVSVGAVAVGVGAAVAGAPALALAASAVATYAAIAGVALSAAAIGNDLVNLGTTVASIYNGDMTFAQAENNLIKQTAALASDGVQAFLQAEGVGGLTTVLDNVAANVWPTVLQGMYQAEASDTALAAGQLATAVGNLIVQNSFTDDVMSAQQSMSDVTLGPNQGWSTLTGSVDIINNQGPILSALTGINVEDGSGNIYLQTMTDTQGNYSLAVPVGTSLSSVGGLMLMAVDPVAGEILDSTTLSISSLTPGSSQALGALSGTCNDDDATDPDSDDPDCD